MTEVKRDWLSVSNSTLLGFIWVLLVGMFTMPLEKIMYPFGYIFRFFAYGALTFIGAISLAKSNKLTLQECRITKPRIHPLGLIISLSLPIVTIMWKIHGEAGVLVYNKMSFSQLLEIGLYLTFHTGFCSGIVEEVMFRGVLTRICEEAYSKRFAWIIPTIFFVIPHLRNIGSMLDFANTCLFMISFSIFLTVLTYRTGTVWDAVLVHAFWDMFAARSNLIEVSAELESNALFTYILKHPETHPLANMSGNEYMWMISIVFLVCAGGLFIKSQKK